MEMNNPLLCTMALASVCAGVQAQTDVTDKYIKNPTLSSNADWVQAGFNNFLDDCAESFCGNSIWNYSLKQSVTLPKGSYRLVGQAFYRQGKSYDVASTTSLAKMVAGTNSITIKPLAGEAVARYADSMAEANEDFGNGLYKNVLDFTLDKETEIEIGFEGTHNDKDSWFIAGDVKLYDLSLDVTSAITNPTFNGNLNGWVNNGFSAQENESYEDKVGSHYVERWQGNGGLPNSDIHQELSLPEGKYSLSVRGRFDGNGLFLYAGDKKVQITRGLTTIDNIEIPAGGGKLTIGVKLENATSNWARFDDFHLSVDMGGNLPEELSRALAIQINKTASVDLDDWLKELTLKASQYQVEINNFDFEAYKNYKEDNEKSLKVRINTLGTDIDHALKNLTTKNTMDEAGQEMDALLAELGEIVEAIEDEAVKSAANGLKTGLDGRVENFKNDVNKAYIGRSLWSSDEFSEQVAEIKEAISDAKKTVATNDQNAIASAAVKEAIGAVRNKYANILNELFFQLSEGENAVYSGLYLKASTDLNVQNRRIQAIEAEANTAGEDGTITEKKDGFIAELTGEGEESIMTAMDGVSAKYLKYKENHLAALADIKDEVQAKLDGLKAEIGDCQEVLVPNQEAIDEIQGYINDLKEAVDAAMNDCAIGNGVDAEFCTDYNEKKTTIIGDVDKLYETVKPQLDEYHAFMACNNAIAALQGKLNDAKKEVNALVSTDENYAVNGRYAKTESDIQEVVNEYTAAASEAYKNKKAQEYLTELTGKITATEGAIEAYKNNAAATLADYNAIAEALDQYKNGTENEKGLEALREIVDNQDVTIGGDPENATEGTYGDKIAELEGRIKAIEDAKNEALVKEDAEHTTAMAGVVGMLDSRILSDANDAYTNYKKEADNWNAKQLELAQKRMLEDAQARIALSESLLPENDYDKETYGLKERILNAELEDIRKAISDCGTEVENATAMAPTEAIALLSTTVTKLNDIETRLVNLRGDADGFASEYAAEKQAKEDQLAAIGVQRELLNGDSGKGIVGVLAMMVDDSKKTGFTERVEALEIRITAEETAVVNSFAKETLREDLKDTQDEDGEKVLGILSRLEAISKDINDLRDGAEQATKNYNSHKALTTRYTTTKNIEKALEDATTAINAITTSVKEEDGGTVEAGKAYFLKLVEDNRTVFDGLIDEINQAYIDNEANTEEANLNKEIDDLYTAVTGLAASAQANQQEYDAQVVAYNTVSGDWKDLLTKISTADVSGAHAPALEKLAEINSDIQKYKEAVDAAFAKGSCDADKITIEMQMTAITDALTSLNGSWDKDYLAAIQVDNDGRKNEFNDAYNAAVTAYSEAVSVMVQLSKTASAAGLTSTLKDLVGEDGIYSFSSKIRDLKNTATEEYDAAAEDLAIGKTTLFDPEEKHKAAAIALQKDIEAMRKQYADAVNAEAMNTYNGRYEEVAQLYADAVAAIQDWDESVKLNAFDGVKKILDEAETKTALETFAYELDGILLQFNGIQDMIAADQKTLAVQQWNAEITTVDALMKAELAAIAGFKPEDANYAERYAAEVTAKVDAAKAVREEVEADAIYEKIEDLRAMLALVEYGELEVDNDKIEKHTQVYIDAYQEDYAYRNNDVVYKNMLTYIEGVQKQVNEYEAYVATLYIVNNESVNAYIRLLQLGVNDAYSLAEYYHNVNAAANNMDAIKDQCQLVLGALDGYYKEAVGVEHDAMAMEIGLLKLDYEQAVAKLLPGGTEDTLEGYKDIIAAYESCNDSYKVEFVNGKVDDDNTLVYASKEETQQRYLALEKNVAQTRAQLAEIYYEGDLVGVTADGLISKLNEVETEYTKVVEALADCHDAVVAEYQSEADAFGNTVEDVRNRIAETVDAKTILLYEPVIKETIGLIAEKYKDLLGNIEKMEEPYDVNDEKYRELNQQLNDLLDRLNAVVEVASAYKYADRSEPYRQNRYEAINAWIAYDRETVEGLNEKGTGLVADSKLRYAEIVANETSLFEDKLAYFNSIYTIQQYQWELDATNLRTDVGYLPADRWSLLGRRSDLQDALIFMRNFNESVKDNGYTYSDINGEYVGTIEDGVEQPKPYAYMDAYAEVMAKVVEVEEAINTLRKDIDDSGYKLGDINRDGKINVTDYTEIRSIVVGAEEVEEGSVKFFTADANGDGDINIGDVTTVANLIMYPERVSSNNVARRIEYYVENLQKQDDVVSVAVEGKGTAQRIAISLDNACDYVGLQMDVKLPEGVKVVNEILGARAENHDLISNDLNGAHRILVSTLENTEIGNNGVVVYLDVEVSADYAGGNIEVNNILCADAESHVYQVNGLMVGDATGITELSTVEKATSKIYNIGGQVMDTLKKGINIIVNSDGTTKKVLKK